jgi:hypothetical protein
MLIDFGDAAVQALLALVVESTHDHEKHGWLIDALLTVPPLAEWPSECREMLLETCHFMKGLADDLSGVGVRCGMAVKVTFHVTLVAPVKSGFRPHPGPK